jgi:hypothetical protein
VNRTAVLQALKLDHFFDAQVARTRRLPGDNAALPTTVLELPVSHCLVATVFASMRRSAAPHEPRVPLFSLMRKRITNKHDCQSNNSMNGRRFPAISLRNPVAGK